MESNHTENDLEREDLAAEIVNSYVWGRKPGKRQMVVTAAALLGKGYQSEDLHKAGENWLRSGDRDGLNVYGSEDGFLHFLRRTPPKHPPIAPAAPAPPQTQDTQDSQAPQATQDSQGIQETKDLHLPRASGGAAAAEEEAAAEELDLSTSALYSQRNPEDYELRREEAADLLGASKSKDQLAMIAAEAIADAVPDPTVEVEFGDETTAAAFVLIRRLKVGNSAFDANGQCWHYNESGMMRVAQAWCEVWSDYGDYDPEDFAVELNGAQRKARFVAGSDGTFKTGIKEAAQRSATPLSLKKLESDGYKSVVLLGKICKQFSAARSREGYGTFFLSCRDAGELTGKGKDKALNMLMQLCEAKVIEKIKTGTQRPGGGDATEWKYVGNDEPPETPEKKGAKKPR